MTPPFDSPDHRPTPPVVARFNYLGDQAERPFYHTSLPHLSRLAEDAREASVIDARGLPAISLDREGFVLVDDPLPGLDLRDPGVRDGAYLVHLQDRIAGALGADRVVTDLSNIRLPDPQAWQVPLRTVHADYTAASAREVVGQCRDRSLEEEAGVEDTARLLAASIDAGPKGARFRRVLAVNAWRVISDPPHDLPLALCARDSLAPEDAVVADFLEEYSAEARYAGELLLCRANPAHRWYQFSDMRQDELLLFVEHDFADAACRPVMHSAFRDPGCLPDVPGRASVEVRCFAFFA